MHVHVLGCVRARALVCTQAGQYLRPLLEPCLVLINPCTTHRRPCTSPECKPEPRTPELCGTEIETAASLVESRIGMARRDRNRSHRLTSEYCIAPLRFHAPIGHVALDYTTVRHAAPIAWHSAAVRPLRQLSTTAAGAALCECAPPVPPQHRAVQRDDTELRSLGTRPTAQYYHLRHSYIGYPGGPTCAFIAVMHDVSSNEVGYSQNAQSANAFASVDWFTCAPSQPCRRFRECSAAHADHTSAQRRHAG